MSYGFFRRREDISPKKRAKQDRARVSSSSPKNIMQVSASLGRYLFVSGAQYAGKDAINLFCRSNLTAKRNANLPQIRFLEWDLCFYTKDQYFIKTQVLFRNRKPFLFTFVTQITATTVYHSPQFTVDLTENVNSGRARHDQTKCFAQSTLL